MGENSNSVPKTIFEILRKVSTISDSSEKSSELDFHIHSYADELRRALPFQRHLPLCMELLQEGIVRLEEEKLKCKVVKNSGSMGESRGKRPVEYEAHIDQIPKWTGEHTSGGFRCGGGAFVPYKKPTSELDQLEEVKLEKKARRCWDAELHDQFVVALINLGGPFVATPKKIREEMQVEGLTNDQVKSHLQKFRIHLRKEMGKSPSAGTSSGFPSFQDDSQMATEGYAEDDYDDVSPSNEPTEPKGKSSDSKGKQKAGHGY